jgi:hypothetical protein
LAYVNLLTTPDGRHWCESHRYNLCIPVHLFQDVQHMLSLFVGLAKRSALKGALRNKAPISAQNYWDSARTCDALIDKLRGAITGNGLGPFESIPVCLDWFPKLLVPGQAPTRSGGNDRPAGTTNGSRGNDSGSRGNLQPTAPAAPGGSQLGRGKSPSQSPASKKQRTQQVDPAETARRKTLGLLVYDTAVSGSTRLPDCMVSTKAKVGRERLCMRFMTQGYACPNGDCAHPHITTVKRLSEADAKEFTTWVSKTQGLAFAPGKGPAGTP